MIEAVQTQKASKRITCFFKNLKKFNATTPSEVQKTIRAIHKFSNKLQSKMAKNENFDNECLQAYQELKKLESYLLSEVFIETHLLKIPCKQLASFNQQIQSIRDCIGNLEEQDFLYKTYF